MSKSPEEQEWMKLASRVAASSSGRLPSLRPGEIDELAERTYAFWHPGEVSSEPSVTVAIRVQNEAGRPSAGITVRHPRSTQQPVRTNAAGIVLLKLDRERDANLIIEYGEQELHGSLDIGASASQRITKAKGIVVEARVVQRSQAAFPIKREPVKRGRFRLAVSGTAKQVDEALRFLTGDDCIKLSTVFISGRSKEVQKIPGLKVLRFEDMKGKSLVNIDLLIDLSGRKEVGLLRAARLSGKTRWPTFVISAPHNYLSVLEGIARRFRTEPNPA